MRQVASTHILEPQMNTHLFDRLLMPPLLLLLLLLLFRFHIDIQIGLV